MFTLDASDYPDIYFSCKNLWLTPNWNRRFALFVNSFKQNKDWKSV